jgi:hypothetical protein
MGASSRAPSVTPGPHADYNRGDSIVRYKHAMKGPKTFDEWVEAYEERDDCEYILSPREQVRWDPMHGFFTYLFDSKRQQFVIPKMCGNGMHWKPVILKIFRYMKAKGWVKRIYCFTKRNPKAFVRMFGGEVVAMEYFCDFETGKTCSGWHIAIKE